MVTPTAACVTRKPHSRALGLVRRGATLIRNSMTFMGPCVCIGTSWSVHKAWDRPWFPSSHKSTQLDRLGPVFQRSGRRRESVSLECTYGSVLPHQDGRKETKARQTGGRQTHTHPRRLRAGIGGSNTVPSSSSWSLSQWTPCDTRNATPLNHCGPKPPLCPYTLPAPPPRLSGKTSSE